jgi:hypothetical protein
MFSTTGYFQGEGPIYELRMNIRSVAKSLSQEISSYLNQILNNEKQNKEKAFLTTSIDKLKKTFNTERYKKSIFILQFYFNFYLSKIFYFQNFLFLKIKKKIGEKDLWKRF